MAKNKTPQANRASAPRCAREMSDRKAATPNPTRARENRITTRATNHDRNIVYTTYRRSVEQPGDLSVNVQPPGVVILTHYPDIG
jgi:hypothetical protein